MTTLDEAYARYKQAAGALTPEAACQDDPGLLPLLLERLAEEHVPAMPAMSQATQDYSTQLMAPSPQVAGTANPPAPSSAPPRPPTPLPATPTIPGYRVGKEIGKGGQGIVYEAIQENPKRKVAVKVLLNASHASSEAVYRFKREIDLVASLRHPNIVAVFDTGTTSDGHPFYAMDYVRGIPLTTYVQEHKLSLKATLKLFQVLCDTVNHAHQKGVIHRDLKPSNILVDDQGQLHILDFGLAKQIGESIDHRVSITGQIVGTLPYMAPEQTRGDPDILDIRTDVYALGVMLYELLTGAYPYPVVGAMAEILGHIVHTAPKRLTQSWTRGRGVATASRRRSSTCPIDHEIETIAFKALSKERERRYQSAGELGRDVQHYLNDEAIDAKRDSALYLLRKTMKRHRAAAALVVGVFLLAMVSAIVFWSLRNQAVTAAAGERVARGEAQSAAKQLAVERDKATASLHDAQERLVVASSYDGSYLALTQRPVEARRVLADSLKLLPQTKMSPLWVAVPLLDLNARFPPPLSPASFFQGHTDAVRAVAYTPNGRRCVSGGADRTLRVWDVRTGVLLMTLQGHRDYVYGVAISPDGNQALSGSGDRTLKLWDLQAGKEIRTFQGHADSVRGVAMSMDGKTAVSSGIDGEVIAWDVASGRQIGRIKRNDGVHGVAISPDGKFAVAGEDAGTVVQWELGTGRVVRTLPSSGKPALCVAYSPDGRWILSSGDAADKVKLWDAGSGALVRAFDGHTQPVFSVAFSPDGRKALSASSDRTIRLWDCATGQNIRTFFGHTGGVNSVAFSPDGLTAISGGEDSALKLWRIDEELPCTVFAGGGGAADCVAVSPDNLLILSGSQNGLVTLWDAATCVELQRFEGHRQGVRCVAFSKDGLSFLSAGEDRTIRFWNAAGGSIRTLTGQDCYAISPDGESALTADRRGVLSLLDLGSGTPTRTLRRDPATGETALPTPPECAVFSRDSGRILTGMADGDVDLWDARTGAWMKSWTTPDAGISALAFTANADSALSASMLDTRLTVWDLAKGESRLTMSGHSGMIFNIQSSPDGRTALSGGNDGDLRMWDLQLGREIGSASLRAKSTLLALALSEDGKSAVAGMDNKSLERWDFDRPLRLCELEQKLTDSAKDGAAPSGTLLLLGEWYALRGMDAWAVNVLEEARKAGGKVPALLLGGLYWKLHRYGEARKEYEGARAGAEAPEAYVALCLGAIAREEKLPAATGR